MDLKATRQNGNTKLSWSILQNNGIREIEIYRSNLKNNNFKLLKVLPVGTSYQYKPEQSGQYKYAVKIIYENKQKSDFSNIATISNSTTFFVTSNTIPVILRPGSSNTINRNFKHMLYKEAGLNTEVVDFIALCGNTVRGKAKENIYKFLNERVKIPIYIIQGEKDKLEYLENYPYENFFSIKDEFSQYIFLDTITDHGIIKDKQLAFLNKKLDDFQNSNHKNLFIFMATPLFINNPQFQFMEKVLDTQLHKNSNFYADIFPRLVKLKKNNKKNIYLISGGIKYLDNFFYTNYNGVTLIISGLIDQKSDKILKVKINRNKVDFFINKTVIYNRDYNFLDFKEYSVTYWKKRLKFFTNQ